ncbi:polymorphic toxin-type HINT domain-containing protein [Nocardioides sp. WV_118_6]
MTKSVYDGLSTSLVGQVDAVNGARSKPEVLYQLDAVGNAVGYDQTNVSAGKAFLDTDGNGNITAVTTRPGSGSGVLACGVVYNPYGTPYEASTGGGNPNGVCKNGSQIGTTGNSQWYRGMTRDGSTGTYQMGTRTYDPRTGAFTAPDAYRVASPSTDLSVGTDPLTANTYTYVNGNPLNMMDSDGHAPVGVLEGTQKPVSNPRGGAPGVNSGSGMLQDRRTPSGTVQIGSMGEFDAARPGVAGLKSAWERAAAASGFDGQFPGSWGPGARAFFEAEIWAQVCNQQQVCDSQLTETVGMWRTFVHDRKAGLMSDGASWDKINGGNPVELMLNGTWVDRYAEVTAESSATAEAMLGDAAVGLRALSALRRASGLSKRPQQRPQQGGPCSFAGSTEVLMADGSLKPIDEVVVGDEVVATDPETGEQAAKRVSRVWVHRDDLIALALNADVDGDGRPDRLVTTEDHPFWNATDGVWEGPQDLDVGDELVDDHGRRVGVLGLEPGSTRVGWAYNLTVEDLHTYHVGASRILVHNTKGDGCSTGAANTGAHLAESGFVDPSTIRFSQSSIKATMSKGGSVKDLAAALRTGAVSPGDIPPIRILERNGSLFTLDNRRLAAFQEAGVDIPYRMATPGEIASEKWKFTTRTGGTSIRIRGGD